MLRSIARALRHTVLAASLLAAVVATARGQSNPLYVPLGAGVNAALYKPDNNPKIGRAHV